MGGLKIVSMNYNNNNNNTLSDYKILFVAVLLIAVCTDYHEMTFATIG